MLSKMTQTAAFRRLQRRGPRVAVFARKLREAYEEVARASRLDLAELQAAIDRSQALMDGFIGGVQAMSGEPPLETEGTPDGGDDDEIDEPTFEECMQLCDAQYTACLEQAEKIADKAGNKGGRIIGALRGFEERSACDWNWWKCWDNCRKVTD
jgi:hypothetical protein